VLQNESPYCNAKAPPETKKCTQQKAEYMLNIANDAVHIRINTPITPENAQTGSKKHKKRTSTVSKYWFKHGFGFTFRYKEKLSFCSGCSRVHLGANRLVWVHFVKSGAFCTQTLGVHLVY